MVENDIVGHAQGKESVCGSCKGSGRRIVDWHAYNQLSLPVGLSSYAREQWQRNFEKAYGPCPDCGGTGKARAE